MRSFALQNIEALLVSNLKRKTLGFRLGFLLVFVDSVQFLNDS